MTAPTKEDYTQVLTIMARLATANRQLVAHMRVMASIMDEQQQLLDTLQPQMDDLKMRLAVLEAARERGK